MPRPSSPTSIDQRVVVLDLARSVGAVAALVLQALNEDAVGAAVGQQARHEQAAHAGFGLRQRVEPVGYRHREKPFVAGDRIDLAMRAAFDEACGRLGLAQIGAALLLGHRIADDRAHAWPRWEAAADRSPPPAFVSRHVAELRLAGEAGDRGVSHPGRATDAVLDLIPEIAQRRAREMSDLARA